MLLDYNCIKVLCHRAMLTIAMRCINDIVICTYSDK